MPMRLRDPIARLDTTPQSRALCPRRAFTNLLWAIVHRRGMSPLVVSSGGSCTHIPSFHTSHKDVQCTGWLIFLIKLSNKERYSNLICSLQFLCEDVHNCLQKVIYCHVNLQYLSVLHY